MSITPAVAALRESFGDRKLPDISRKITACVACRRLKIKCHMLDAQPPCTRCRSRGLSCKINKSLQTILESDVSWKEQMEHRMKRLEDAISCGPIDNPNLSRNDLNLAGPTVDGLRDLGSSSISATSFEPIKNKKGTITLNLSSSLGAFPASSITKVAIADRTFDPACRPDVISSGVVSLSIANDYLTFYKHNLDPHINYLVAKTDNLPAIRARSSMLTAAICTVAAFCIGSNEYEACLAAFTAEISGKLFADKYNFDDVRALCIGALWLNDISSALNGLAVRIGTQLDLHRCITKMPHTKQACYDRTRLYFQVYLCDHHCSLVYGRPPMTTEFRSLKGPGAFLQSEFSCGADVNLIGQVELWSINRRVFHLFGSDIESSIVNERYLEIGRLNDALDRWYADWRGLIVEDDSDCSLRTFNLYLHFAKLYLYSHVFRGPSLGESPSDGRKTNELAQNAADSALAILRGVVDGNEGPAWLEKLPFYFGTMIAFACVYLIRTSLTRADHSDARTTEITHYLHRLARVLQQSRVSDISTRPLLNIAKSLEAAIQEHSRSTQHTSSDFNVNNTFDFVFDFDLFANNPLNLNFPGVEDNWMFCPDQMTPTTF